MNFEYSEKSLELQQRLSAFIEEHIVPIEKEYIAFQSDTNNMWQRFPKIEMLKKKAKGKMPLKSYALLHGELSEEDEKIFLNWVQTLR